MDPARHLTKLLSILSYILKKLTSHFKPSSSSSPSPSSNHQVVNVQVPDPVPDPPGVQLELDPILQMLQEQELGKLVLNLAVTVGAALLLSDKFPKFLVAHFISVGLVMGFMAIWNGIILRRTCPRLANVLELFGVIVVLLLLCGLVGSSLPKHFFWILWLFGAFSLLPLMLSLISYIKQMHGQRP